MSQKGATKTHQTTSDFRDRVGTSSARFGAMTCLVSGHLLENFAAAMIGCGQPRQVIIEMGFDLSFRFLDEAKAASVSGERGCGADREASHVPQWCQPARLSAELAETLRAPGEVIVFLFGGIEQMPLCLCGARKDGLTVVQRLRRDFACMIDAHEPDALRTGICIEMCV